MKTKKKGPPSAGRTPGGRAAGRGPEAKPGRRRRSPGAEALEGSRPPQPEPTSEDEAAERVGQEREEEPVVEDDVERDDARLTADDDGMRTAGEEEDA